MNLLRRSDRRSARFGLARLILAILAIFVPIQLAHAADGTSELIITYHCAVADRPAFRKALIEDALTDWAALKAKGVLADFRLWGGRYADGLGVDALAILSFASPAQSRRWAEVERDHPGGLPPRAAKFVSAVETAPADLARRVHGGPDAVSQPVMLAIPYNILVGKPDYLAYVDTYVLPQIRGWIDEGAVADGALYLPRYGAGRHWSALLLLTYRGDDGLNRREEVVAKVRARLREDPQWRAASDNKAKIRDELPPIVLDPIAEDMR